MTKRTTVAIVAVGTLALANSPTAPGSTPPDEPMFMYVQLSVKPPDPAAPTDESKFPAHYRVDYVRVYQ